MADILLIRASTEITDADVEAAIVAFNTQITRDFAPAWGTPGTVFFGQGPEGSWQFHLQDGLDQPGDLGYHDDGTGLPEARIDIRGARANGADWRTVVSHELLEALADPLCTRMSPDGVTMLEVCDPVEQSLYLIDDMPVSNFVLPSYFGFNSSARYDFNAQLTAGAPALLGGGYIMQNIDGKWISHFSRQADGRLSWMATRPSGRRTWRMRDQVK